MKDVRGEGRNQGRVLTGINKIYRIRERREAGEL